jgi:Rieske Fe-S protein
MTDDEKRTDRRRFLQVGGAVAVGASCGCMLTGCKAIRGKGDTPDLERAAYEVSDGVLTIDLAKASALGKVGGAARITAGVSPNLIVARTGSDSYVVASIKCTHGGREVEYQHGSKRFRCVSFGHSKFATNGKKKSGPASKKLPVYAVKLEQGKLIVKL